MKRRGVTLVELLITLALSSLTLVTAMQFLGAGLRANADVSALSSLYDKAQHAMLLFGNAVKSAGYLGCGGSSSELQSLLRGDFELIPEINLLQPYALYKWTGAGLGWSPELGEIPIRIGGSTLNAIDGRNAIRVDALVPGNDVLVVRGLGFQVVPIVGPVESGAAIRVRTRRGLTRGDFAAIGDCRHLEIFRISGYRTSGGLTRLTRNHGIGRYDNHPLKLQNSSAFSGFAGQGPWLFPIETEFLYIAEGHADAAIPALWRKQTQKRPLEVIEGISELEVIELADADGHTIGLRVSISAMSAPSTRSKPLKRRFTRHFAFENL